MYCFFRLDEDNSHFIIPNVPQDHCDSFVKSMNRLNNLLQFHSLFDHVRIAYENTLIFQGDNFDIIIPDNVPYSLDKLTLVDKTCKDYVFHYMAYTENLLSFTKRQFGHNNSFVKRIEQDLQSLNRIPECSFIHSIRNYVTHVGGMLSYVVRSNGSIKPLISKDELLKSKDIWQKRDIQLIKSQDDYFDVSKIFSFAYDKLFTFHGELAADFINMNNLAHDIAWVDSCRKELEKYRTQPAQRFFIADARREIDNRSVTLDEYENGLADSFTLIIYQWHTIADLATYIRCKETV